VGGQTRSPVEIAPAPFVLVNKRQTRLQHLPLTGGGNDGGDAIPAACGLADKREGEQPPRNVEAESGGGDACRIMDTERDASVTWS
jgi:hypothetical protein